MRLILHVPNCLGTFNLYNLVLQLIKLKYLTLPRVTSSTIYRFVKLFQSQNTPAEQSSDKDSSNLELTSNGTSSDPQSLTEQADLVDETPSTSKSSGYKSADL